MDFGFFKHKPNNNTDNLDHKNLHFNNLLEMMKYLSKPMTDVDMIVPTNNSFMIDMDSVNQSNNDTRSIINALNSNVIPKDDKLEQLNQIQQDINDEQDILQQYINGNETQDHIAEQNERIANLKEDYNNLYKQIYNDNTKQTLTKNDNATNSYLDETVATTGNNEDNQAQINQATASDTTISNNNDVTTNTSDEIVTATSNADEHNNQAQPKQPTASDETVNNTDDVATNTSDEAVATTNNNENNQDELNNHTASDTTISNDANDTNINASDETVTTSNVNEPMEQAQINQATASDETVNDTDDANINASDEIVTATSNADEHNNQAQPKQATASDASHNDEEQQTMANKHTKPLVTNNQPTNRDVDTSEHQQQSNNNKSNDNLELEKILEETNFTDEQKAIAKQIQANLEKNNNDKQIIATLEQFEQFTKEKDNIKMPNNNEQLADKQQKNNKKTKKNNTDNNQKQIKFDYLDVIFDEKFTFNLTSKQLLHNFNAIKLDDNKIIFVDKQNQKVIFKPNNLINVKQCSPNTFGINKSEWQNILTELKDFLNKLPFVINTPLIHNRFIIQKSNNK